MANFSNFLGVLVAAQILLGCESGLQVSTDGLIDETCIQTDGKDCALRDAAAAEQGFQLFTDGQFTNLGNPSLRWSQYIRANGGRVSYRLVAAADEACTKPIQSFSGLEAAKQGLASLSDGTYYFCLFAQVKGQDIPAINNGVRLTIDREAPKAEGEIAFEKNGPFQLDFNIYDMTLVKLKWAVVEGPNDVTFSDAVAKNATISMAGEGPYKIKADLTDQAGNTSSKLFDIIWDQTPPAIKFDSTLFLGSSTQLSAPVIATDVVSYAWSVVSSPANAKLTLSDLSIPNPMVSANVNGVYQARLTVKDRAGNSASDVLNIDWNTSPIIFTSAALVGLAADGFINDLDSRTDNSVIVGDPVGSSFTVAQYKLVAQNINCPEVTAWEAAKPLASTAKMDGSYKVCVKLSDNRGKTPAYGSTPAFVRKVALPVFKAISLNGEAADGYINRAERTGTNNLVANLNATDFNTAAYALVPFASNCSAVTTYAAAIPRSDSTSFGADGVYKVCVRLTDNAANPAQFGQSSAITLDGTVPIFTSMTPANEASDGFVSSVEVNSTRDAYVLSAAGYEPSMVRYTAFLPASTMCDANKAYTLNAIPLIRDIPKTDGAYLVCAKLMDVAGNITYGQSQVINRSTVPPTATIAGQPTGTSNVMVLDITVAGVGVTHYNYKIGSSALDCADVSGYSAERLVSQKITDSIAGIADGDIKVCVVGRNAIGSRQLESNATVRTWTKDTVVPTVAITAPLTINKASQGSVTISGTCSENGRTITIGGAKAASATCSSGAWSVSGVNYASVSDGNVSITADLTDAAGNKAVQASFSAVKDTVPPTLTFAPLPPINNANKSMVPVSGSCSENGRDVVLGGDRSLTVTCSLGAWSAIFDYSMLADGSVVLTAEQTDALGNTSAKISGTLTKDTVNPTVTLSATPVINNQNKAIVPVSGTCSDSGQNVVIGGAVSKTVSCTANAWSTTLNYTGAGEGNVAITLDHSDAVGNKASQVSASLQKDTLLPTVSFTQIPVINRANMAAVPLKGNCSEVGRQVNIGGAKAGVTQCTASGWSIAMDYSSLGEGKVSVTADISDEAGNNAIQAKEDLTKDTTGPTVSINSIFINLANRQAVPVSGVCSENNRTVTISGAVSTTTTCVNGVWSKAIDYSQQNDGNVNVKADISDAAGNDATQANLDLIKDTAIPSVALDPLPIINEANKTAVPVSGTCSEDGQSISIGGAITSGSTCSGGRWAAALNFSSVADSASVAITADHRDAAGNNAVKAAGTLNKDTVRPLVGFDPLVIINASNKSAVPVSGTCSENGATVVIGGAASSSTTCVSGKWAKTLDYSAASDGGVAINVSTTDGAGNPSLLASATFTKDTGLPTVSLNSALINIQNKAGVVLSGTCSEVNRNVTIGGAIASTSVVCPANKIWTKSIDFSAIADGNVQINVTHTDEAGNQAIPASTSFVKDTVAPILSFDTLPAINNLNKTAVPVSGACSEEGRPVSLSGGATGTVTCSNGKWSASVDLSALADSLSIKLTISQTDAANNSAQKDGFLKKDTVNPTAAIQDVVINIANAAAVTLRGSCSENTLTVAISGAVSTNVVCNALTWSTVANLTGEPDGPVTVNIEHKDTAGNVVTASKNLLKDTEAPTIFLDPLPAISGANSTTVHVSGSCSENGQKVFLGGPRTADVLCAFGVWAFDVNYSGVAEGGFGITINHSDAAGNPAVQVNGTLIKDTKPPTLTINSLIVNIANKSAALLSGTCSEEGVLVEISGAVTTSATCQSNAWYRAADFSSVPDGSSVTVKAKHTDAFGNSTETTRLMLKDTVAPTVSLGVLGPINAGNQGAVPVSGTCSENGQIVTIGGAVSDSTACILGNWSKALNYRNAEDGSVAITVSHKDLAGNDAIVATSQFTKDVVVPTVDAGPDRVVNASFTQNAVVNGGATYSWTKVVGNGTVTFGSPNAQDTTISASNDGNYVLRLTVTDAAGNSNADEMNLKWDTTPPTPVLTGAPVDTSDVNTLNITVSGNDLVEYAYKLLEGGATDCSNGANYSFFRSSSVPITDDITLFPYGSTAKVCVVGKDSVGNVSSYASAASATWLRDAPSYRFFRLVTTSLQGDCVSGKAVIENLELKINDNWQAGSFDTTVGILGIFTGVTASSSSSTPGNEAWRALGDGYWQGTKEFDTTDPYDSQVALSFIKLDFGAGKQVAVQGLRIKGGTTGESQFCAPDAFRLEGSQDNTNWKEVVGSKRSMHTDQQAQYLFRPKPGKVDSLTLQRSESESFISASWDYAGGTEVGHIVVRRTDSPVTWVPTKGVGYTAGEIDSDHTIVYVGPAKSTVTPGIIPGKTYHYAIYSYDINKLYSEGTKNSTTP